MRGGTMTNPTSRSTGGGGGFRLQSSISIIDPSSEEEEDQEVEDEDEDEDYYGDTTTTTRTRTRTTPFQQQIIQIVKSCPNYTIRPGKLSQEMGISITDASAELCGLLVAVGKGSTFYFEDTTSSTSGTTTQKPILQKTMVFTFPNDFEQRAIWTQQRNDWKTTIQYCIRIGIRALKILTAFGLILSLLIVSIAAMLALLAAIVAISRGDNNRSGGNNQNSILMRQFRHLCLTVRQVVWFYALFGNPVVDRGDESSSQDPFLRDVAYDMWLILSLCCGNPSSIFFWLRASHLQRRRRRTIRGWERNVNSSLDDGYVVSTPSTIQGITLLRRGDPTTTITTSSSSTSSSNNNEQRGILSIAAEFLFGPMENMSTSTSLQQQQHQDEEDVLETNRWKLCAAVILQKSTVRLSKSTNGVAAISLQELSAYAKYPASSLNDTFPIVAEGLRVVSHFNGIPAVATTTVPTTTTPSTAEGAAVDNATANTTATDTGTTIQALFTFPELLAESRFATRYDDFTTTENDTFQSLLYVQPSLSSYTGATTTPFGGVGRLATTDTTSQQQQQQQQQGKPDENTNNDLLPNYFHEPRHLFTKLQPHQFYLCLSLGILNLLGVYWFAQSVQPGGILQQVFGIGIETTSRGGAGIATNSAVGVGVVSSTAGGTRGGGLVGGVENSTSSSSSSSSILLGMLQLLITILKFYAKLFFTIPMIRLLWIMISNYLLQQRNQNRKALAKALLLEEE